MGFDVLLLLLSIADCVTAWQPEKHWKQEQTMKSVSHTLVKCQSCRFSVRDLQNSYSWREVWATDRPLIRCRCFQRFSGCHAVAHSARLDNNNNTSNPSPASALYYYSTFNKWRRCAWWVFFSTQFADRLRNASTSIVGKNTAKVWWFLFTLAGLAALRKSVTT